IARLGRLLDRNLTYRNLHGSPAILDMSAKPHPHSPRRAHLLEFEPGNARDTDARNGRHLLLVVLRRRISPDWLDRTEGKGLVIRRTPVHHHGPDRAFQPSDTLLLMPRRRVGQLRQNDLAA